MFGIRRLKKKSQSMEAQGFGILIPRKLSEGDINAISTKPTTVLQDSLLLQEKPDQNVSGMELHSTRHPNDEGANVAAASSKCCARRADLRRSYTLDSGQKKFSEKRDRKIHQKPKGTNEYVVESRDTLNAVALKFDTTPNELVQLNKLFSQMIVPGQVLYVPDKICISSEDSSPSISPVSPLSPTSSEADIDKDQDHTAGEVGDDNNPPALVSNPGHHPRAVSSTSEEEEALNERFLKINCKYITHGKGIVGGVLLVTPNNIMFDPHKTDSLVLENGCEEYGIMCPLEEVTSASLYRDIANPQLKMNFSVTDDWESKGLKQSTSAASRVERSPGMDQDIRLPETGTDSASTAPRSTDVSMSEEVFTESELSPIREETASSEELEASGQRKDCIEIHEGSQSAGEENGHATASVGGFEKGPKTEEWIDQSGINFELDLSLNKKTNGCTAGSISAGDTNTSAILRPGDDSTSDKVGDKDRRSDSDTVGESDSITTDVTVLSDEGRKQRMTTGADGESQHELENLRKLWKSHVFEEPQCELNASPAPQLSTTVSTKGFAGKRTRGPIMFLCLRVCKPMIKTFVSHIKAVMQQYAQRDTEPEYWFAVPQERSDHLLAFFVQWTPEAYSLEGSEAGSDGGFVVLPKPKELEMIDDYYQDPLGKEWEVVSVNEYHHRIDELNAEELHNLCERLKIVTTNESKRRGHVAVASMDVGPDANKPTLKADSAILEPEHIEKLAVELPPRTVGYPWTLLYSTSKHGMSLKTLYRTMTNTDAPVLLVIKDTDKQVFGALASDPFKVSDHFFGTGETFLFAFNPAFKSYKWTGENMFFIKGDMDSLAIGGGSGQFGLWLDEDLYHGRSHFCKTFNNDTLSKKEDFFIQELECWVFE
uniref:oxidation resistance protein 1-like isoform X2 n=1 Tax=Myxine glutinosa TaxID=7769 RepID=UPI00358E81AE